MTDKRLPLALFSLALLAACNEEPADDGRAASGEVLEGTISDAMLPVDRVRSEPPLEDPEAFAEAQEEAADAAEVAERADGTEAAAPDADGGETSETTASPLPDAAE